MCKGNAVFFPSLLSIATPHTVSDLLTCLPRPVSVLSTGKCHCSAWLEATGPASCPFTSSWLCGESKTMALLILTGPLVLPAKQLVQSPRNKDDRSLKWQTWHAALWHLLSFLNRYHWLQRPRKHSEGNSCWAYTVKKKKRKTSIQCLSVWNCKGYHRAFVMASVLLVECCCVQ